jgi:hypothetical protein
MADTFRRTLEFKFPRDFDIVQAMEIGLTAVFDILGDLEKNILYDGVDAKSKDGDEFSREEIPELRELFEKYGSEASSLSAFVGAREKPGKFTFDADVVVQISIYDYDRELGVRISGRSKIVIEGLKASIESRIGRDMSAAMAAKAAKPSNRSAIESNSKRSQSRWHTFIPDTTAAIVGGGVLLVLGAVITWYVSLR